jgi:hypothetical protein
MATIISSKKKDFEKIYTGFDKQAVGLGTISPDIFKTKGLRKKKVDKILIGTLNEIIYTGFENDRSPLVLVMAFESSYNTIIGYNMNYAPEKIRKAILDIVIKSNRARIKKNSPIIIDYSLIKKAVPQSMGMIRRYKIVGVKVINQYGLNEWRAVIKKKSKWQNMYKDKKRAKTGAFEFLKNIFKRFRGG